MHKRTKYCSAATLFLVLGSPVAAGAASFAVRSSQKFNTSYADRQQQVDSSGATTSISATEVTGQGPALTIAYDALRGTYTLRGPSAAATFGPSQKSVSGYYNVYTKASSSAKDRLSLFNNSAVSAPIKLSYVSFGSWSHTNLTSGAKTDYYFLYGYPTASSSMPRTGGASYSTFLTGSSVRTGAGAGNYQVGGNATFSANFGTGAVNTQLNLTRLQPTGNWAIGSFNGSGSIYASSQFDGNFTTTVPSFIGGSFYGGFYGPGAAEMGYNFYIALLSTDPYACAALPCAYYESIIGTVVGKK